MLLYNIGIRLYFFAIYLASFINKKARLWINGRKDNLYAKYGKSVWFHFASLGEFEQGRPVLEYIRNAHPEKKIVVTFFSPSGYEIRKDTPLADAVYYLPLDTAANAREFIDAIQPEMAIFTKYEYWYYFFRELNQRQVPLYIISGIFRPGQVFFKWYGGLHRKMLSFVTCFFVQDEASERLLHDIDVTNVKVSGDTRFDRVWANSQKPKELKVVNSFKNGHKLFIGGSTWSEDERLVASLVLDYADWKFIFAPHEISEEKINVLISLLPDNSAILYSQLDSKHLPLTNYQTLIIDNIGMLSSLYQYADIAYIGGGFGVGIHNILEAAAFGLPVIFGPNYEKFKEARDLVAQQTGFSINNEPELKSTVAFLVEDNMLYAAICDKARDYVKENTGATDIIVRNISLI
jgi:3-deoxy-D-manno-octulosonic-acid transferase